MEDRKRRFQIESWAYAAGNCADWRCELERRVEGFRQQVPLCHLLFFHLENSMSEFHASFSTWLLLTKD